MNNIVKYETIKLCPVIGCSGRMRINIYDSNGVCDKCEIKMEYDEIPKYLQLYDTKLRKWHHGEVIKFPLNNKLDCKLLGPCPSCGERTFDHREGWRCFSINCEFSPINCINSNNTIPTWWNNNINVLLDGNNWCAIYGNFKNLQSSVAGFGKTPELAVQDLKKNK